MQSKPSRLADRAVPPVLLTAGIGLLVGDATAAAAIMRPDYASGPQLGDDLTTICQIGECVTAGIVIRRPDIFEQMAEIDLLLFDSVPAIEAKKTVLDDVEVLGDMPAADLLAYACCACEIYTTHGLKL